MSLHKALFLTATDTTIGFLSQDSGRLDRVKKRPSHMPYIRVYPTLSAIKGRRRLPRQWRKRLRRSSHTSYILPCGESFRLVRDPRHLLLLRRLGWAYSTSANLSGAYYDESYARSVADIIVEPLGSPSAPSLIFKLGKRKLRRLR
ncbi:Sua5 YciO YrdC YwlC family protein [Nitratifractor sp.]